MYRRIFLLVVLSFSLGACVPYSYGEGGSYYSSQVYSSPAPAYYSGGGSYSAAPRYYQPAPRYYQPAPRYYGPRAGYRPYPNQGWGGGNRWGNGGHGRGADHGGGRGGHR